MLECWNWLRRARNSGQLSHFVEQNQTLRRIYKHWRCAMRLLLVVLILSTVSLAQDARIEEVGKSPVEAKFVSGGRIRMDLCASGAQIVGTDDPVLRVSYHPELDAVRVRLRISGDRAELRFTGCRHNN